MSDFYARCAAALAAGAVALTVTAAGASDTGPVFVVPSRPGVPVAINGRDAAWHVVEGDIGLARPGHLTPVVIGGGRPLPPRWGYDYNPHYNPYFPRDGVAPRRGRNEIEPPRNHPLPPPAESFSRSWSTRSLPQYYSYGEQRYPEPQRSGSYSSETEQLPPTIEDPQQQQFPPPVVVVPERRRR
jgi:hypothetical protein